MIQKKKKEKRKKEDPVQRAMKILEEPPLLTQPHWDLLIQ